MPLDLLVPDLLPALGAAGAPAPSMPHLQRWLARADVERLDLRTAADCIAAAYGLEDAAVAPIAWAGDAGRAEPGAWLRADPVHARIEGDGLVLHDAALLEIRLDEAHALVAALQAFFGGDGLEFHVAAAQRWYVRLPREELPRATPLEEALGRDLFRRLPQGGGSINWPSAVTEVQMLLSSHEVNAAREAQRRPAINAVWFWGGGALPERVPRRYAQLHATDPFPRGLGLLSGASVSEAPPTPDRVDAVRAEESALVVLEDLTAPRRRGDATAWREAAERLDATWFAGLQGLVDRFEAVRLVLPGARDTVVATLRPGSRWRLLRSRKPLADYA